MPPDNDKTIVIVGATGTGKTALACALAREVNGEIISADSRQVYRYLDVGTNKTGAWDEKLAARVADGIPQHLTDLITPAETFSAGDFARRALEKIRQLHAFGKTPIVAGGTGLYIKALVDGLAPLPDRDETLRNELRRDLEQYGVEHLYRQLLAVDPVSAAANRHNPQRLIRSLEVYRITGIPLSTLHGQTRAPDEQFVQFGLRWEKEDLYRLLDRRCEYMLERGMVEETQKVLSRGFPADSPGLQSLGYRDVVRCLKGKISREESLRLLRLDTRHYAKRQATWFNRDPRIAWLETGSSSFDPASLGGKIMQIL